MTDARDPAGNLLPDGGRLTAFGRWLRRASLDELRAVLHLLVHDPTQLQRKRENAYKAGHHDYDIGAIARQWEELFQALRLMC